MRAMVIPILATMLLACRSAPPKVSLASPGARAKKQDYGRLLRRWTRRAAILRELDTSLKVHATWISPEFRAAYVARYSDLFKLPAAERAKLESELASVWDESFPFVFGAATHDFTWNDFHRKESVWRIVLLNDRGDEVKPLEIKRDKRITPTTKAFYPYLEAFYELYRIRFPKTLADGSPLITDGTNRVRLRFSGPLGSAELVWQLQ